MTTTWISATEVTLTLTGGAAIQLTCTDYTSGLAPTVGTKPVIGQAFAGKVATQGDGSFSASGSGTIENVSELAAYRVPAAMPVTVTATFGLGGNESFDTFLTTVDFSLTGDDEMEWALDGDIDGTTYVYTPPV